MVKKDCAHPAGYTLQQSLLPGAGAWHDERPAGLPGNAAGRSASLRAIDHDHDPRIDPGHDRSIVALHNNRYAIDMIPD